MVTYTQNEDERRRGQNHHKEKRLNTKVFNGSSNVVVTFVTAVDGKCWVNSFIKTVKHNSYPHFTLHFIYIYKYINILHYTELYFTILVCKMQMIFPLLPFSFSLRLTHLHHLTVFSSVCRLFKCSIVMSY